MTGLAPVVREVLSDDSMFLTWLKVQNPNTVVGIAWDSCMCPLATFLRSATTHQFYSVDVGATTIDYISSCELVTNPTWVRAFVNRVDTFGKDWEVTAKEALDILRSL